MNDQAICAQFATAVATLRTVRLPVDANDAKAFPNIAQAIAEGKANPERWADLQADWPSMVTHIDREKRGG